MDAKIYERADNVSSTDFMPKDAFQEMTSRPARNKREIKGLDRRRHGRVALNTHGRLMLYDHKEHECVTLNMSPGGIALKTSARGTIGAPIIIYLEHIGRLEGTIIRHLQNGLAVSLTVTKRRRDKLASILTWLANRDILNLPDDRRHERFVPRTPITRIVLPDGRIYECKIIDISLSGAAVATDIRPALGENIIVGRMSARVVRHLEEGFAMEFAAIVKQELLEHLLTAD